jgi:predicted amidohydrolase YtcJ
MFKADKIFYNANVITMNSALPKADAVAVWQNKIVGVGQKKDMDSLAGSKTQIFNLEGKTLMPGFNDNHSHILLLGSSLLNVDCSEDNVKNIEDIRNEIRKRVDKSKPGEWIRCWGYDDSKLLEGRHPCKEDLDDISPNNPVIIDRICGHMLVANSYALRLVGIGAESTDPAGGCIVRRFGSAEPTGLLQENAQIPIREALPEYSSEDVARIVALGTEVFAKNGITSTADASSADALFMIDEAKGWSMAYERNLLKTRVNLLINCIETRKLIFAENLGMDRIKYEIPLKSMLLKNLPIVFSTDVPVIKIDPFITLKSAVDRKTKEGVAVYSEEGITIEQALWAYTAAGAYSTFDERIKGQLIPGMLADLVVLSGNPLTVPLEEITSLKVEMTVLDGEIIYVAQ